MTSASAPAITAATAGATLLVLLLVAPLAGILLAFIARGRHVERIALVTAILGLAIAMAILLLMSQSEELLVYRLGGWAPPLGVALRSDGMSAVMIAISAVVTCTAGFFARADFRNHTSSADARRPLSFWILLLSVSGALNLVFIGGDLFTLYVALEWLTFAAVPLVSLNGQQETLRAALRYFLFALVGSLLYLGGTVLFYGAYGTLDLVLLSQRVDAGAVPIIACALMTVGLLAKTALFPLHFWLPPAHAGAPAAASAVLSGMVVKGSFFLVVRLWFDIMPGLISLTATELLGALGAAAILFGSVAALRQQRLKLMVAYSTVAQIGYLFLMFPLAFDPQTSQLVRGAALSGGLIQACAHATAKAAMFMSAGMIYTALSHDRIADFAGAARKLPLSVLAFALSGLALTGLPPGGAWLAKELMLGATTGADQWWWAAVIQMGGILTGGYVFLVLAQALRPAVTPVTLSAPVSKIQELVTLVLALCSLLLGLFPWHTYLATPAIAPPHPLDGMSSTLWTVLAGAVIAILLGRWGDRPMAIPFSGIISAIIRPARHLTFALGGKLLQSETVLRLWSGAGLALLALTILFMATM